MTTDTQPASPAAIAADIALKLGETGRHAKHQIAQVVELLGPDAAQALLEETQQIEQAGGMLTNDESRRRTPGGIWLHLAKERVSDEDRARIFPKWGKSHKKKRPSTI